MEHNADVDASRKNAAIEYLQDLLTRCAGKSTLQAAQAIVNHTSDHPNPLKDLLAPAGTNGKLGYYCYAQSSKPYIYARHV